MNGKVYFIGAGPGDPELLTLKGKKIIEQADVIVYSGSLVSRDILSFAGKNARIINSAPLNLNEIAGEIADAAQNGLMVARLHTGDPSLYGAIAEQMEALDKEGILYEVIPGVSSAFAAAASLKIEYTLPEITQTLILTRRAGRTPVPDSESITSLARHQSSMVIFLSTDIIDAVAGELIEGGYPKETPAAVVYKASWPDEKRIAGTLETIAEKVKKEGIKRQALILVGQAVGRHMTACSKLYSPDFTHGFRSGQKEAKAGTAVVALTRRGWITGRRILHAVDGAQLYIPLKFQEELAGERVSFYEDIKKEVERLFAACDSLVLIMATGIAIRLIAPHLKTKWEDPAVITMDDSGRNVISMLSGHWGGANDLAVKLSNILGGNPVITTESDVMGFPSIDLMVKALEGGRLPESREVLKNIESAVLDGEDVGFFPKELRFFPAMEGHQTLHFFDSAEELLHSRCSAGVIASRRMTLPEEKRAKYYHITPRDIVIGIGCHKGITAREIGEAIEAALQDAGISLKAIACLCSIDQKKGEAGLSEYAELHNIPLKYFSAKEINRVQSPSPQSRHALKVMGVHGVAEPCAILGSRGGALLMHKVKLKNMTLAVSAIPLKQIIEEGQVDYD